MKRLLLLLALLATSVLAAERPPHGSPLGAVARFFSFAPSTPVTLRESLDAYLEGRFFDAIGAAGAVLDDEALRVHDDAHLVRGLALLAIGWEDLAVQSLEAVLGATPPSPYAPLALLRMIESHYRRGRMEAVAAAYARHFEKPWSGDSARDRRLRNLFLSYGDVHEGSEPTQAERDLLQRTSELADRLRDRRERPTERILYLAGLALFRLDRHAESLRTLERLGLLSSYHPYALYTRAQSLHALGRGDEALALSEVALSFPPVTREERILGERASLLHAALLFEHGSANRALRAAGAVRGDGFYALQARLLRGRICLETERPSLAVTYFRDVDGAGLGPGLEAARGLGLGNAYAALGEFHAAAEALRGAAAEVERARLGDVSETVDQLRSLAERQARRRAEQDERRRRRIAEGIRRVAESKGPMSLRKLFRFASISQRNTVVGAPVHDLELLSTAPADSSPEAVSATMLWADFLQSNERTVVEEMFAWLLARETADRLPESEARLRSIDAELKLIDGSWAAADEAVRVDDRIEDSWQALFPEGAPTPSPFVIESGAPRGPQIAGARRRFIAGWRGVEGAERRVPGRVSDDVSRRVEAAAIERIREFLLRREDRLRRLEYELHAALSTVLAARSETLESVKE